MLYHHGHILSLAKKAYERSLTDSSESFVSIMLSSNALECYVNDFAHSASTELLSTGIASLRDMSFVLKQLETSRTTLISKIECIYYFLSGEKPDRGSSRFQDLSYLVKLRNELVHRKPESTGDWGIYFDDTQEPHSLVQYLANKKIIDMPGPKSPPVWGQFLNVPEVARWAYNFVTVLIKDITRMLPESHLKRIHGKMAENRKEI